MGKKALLKRARSLAERFCVTKAAGFRLGRIDPGETLDFGSEDKPQARQALAAGVASRQPEPGAHALQAVLDRAACLVDGDPVGGRAPETVPLREAAVIEVLPPFAGG